MLLDLASLIFEEQQSLEVILKKIAATIISFMQVQKCTIFIVDEDCSVSTECDFYFYKDRTYTAFKHLVSFTPSLKPDCVWCLPKARGGVSCSGRAGQRCGRRGLRSPFASVSLAGTIGTGVRTRPWSAAPPRGAEVPRHEVPPFPGQGQPCTGCCGQVGPPLHVGSVYTFPFTGNCLKNKSQSAVEAAFLKVPVSPRSLTNMETHSALLTGTFQAPGL